MMEVKCTPTWDDVLAFNTFALKTSPEVRKRLVISWFVFTLGTWTLAAVFWLSGVYPPLAIGVTVAGAIIALGFPLLRRVWIRQYAWQSARANAHGGISQFTMTLADDVFRVRGEVTEVIARWEKMKGVVVGEGRTYILITDQFAVVVSPAALGGEVDYAAVRDFAVAKLRPLS
jgi:hypothetical protein